ncbi:MAG: hypothetical protein AAFZ09_01055, partial [Pseudomonadota bacterium]
GAAVLMAAPAPAGEAGDALSAETRWQSGTSILGLAGSGGSLERAASPDLGPIERGIPDDALSLDTDCRDRPPIAIGFEAPDPGGVSNPYAVGTHRDFVLMIDSMGAMNDYARRGVAVIACR